MATNRITTFYNGHYSTSLTQASHRRLNSSATLSPSQCIKTLQEPAKTLAAGIVIKANKGHISYSQAAGQVRHLRANYTKWIQKVTGQAPVNANEAQDALAQLGDHLEELEEAKQALAKKKQEEERLKAEHLRQLEKEVKEAQQRKGSKSKHHDAIEKARTDEWMRRVDELSQRNEPETTEATKPSSLPSTSNTTTEAVVPDDSIINDLEIKPTDSEKIKQLKLARLRAENETRVAEARARAIETGRKEDKENYQRELAKSQEETKAERRKRFGAFYWKRIVLWGGMAASIPGSVWVATLAEDNYHVRQFFQENEITHLRPSKLLIQGRMHADILWREGLEQQRTNRTQAQTRLTYQYKHKRDFSSSPVIIDAGHGGKDGGSCGNADGSRVKVKNKMALCKPNNPVHEKTLNLEFSLLLREELRKRGIPTELTRADDRFIPIRTRNRVGPLFISIHHDVPNRKEYVELYCPKKPASSCDFATHLESSMSPEFNTRIHPKRDPRGLGVFNPKVSSEMADQSVLIELGPTHKKMRKQHQQQAVEIADAVYEYLKDVVPPTFIKTPQLETGIIATTKEMFGGEREEVSELEEDSGIGSWFSNWFKTQPDGIIEEYLDVVNYSIWERLTRQTKYDMMVDTIEHYSWKHGIDPFLVYGIRGQIKDNSLQEGGFMGLTEEARRISGAEDHKLQEETYNIRMAIDYLSKSSYGVIRWLEHDLNYNVPQQTEDAIVILAYMYGEERLKSALKRLDKQNIEITQLSIIDELAKDNFFKSFARDEFLDNIQKISQFRKEKRFEETGSNEVNTRNEEYRQELYQHEYIDNIFEARYPGQHVTVTFKAGTTPVTITDEQIKLVHKYAKREGLDPNYIIAVINLEAAKTKPKDGVVYFDEKSVAKAWVQKKSGKTIYSYGLMQLKPAAAKDAGCTFSKDKLLKQDYNIKCGTKYFALMFNKVKQYERRYGFSFSADRRIRLTGFAYNAGAATLNDALARLHEQGKTDFTEDELIAMSRRNISSKPPHRAKDDKPLTTEKIRVIKKYMNGLTAYSQISRQYIYQQQHVEKLSTNFSVRDLEHSNTAKKRGIDNRITQEEYLRNARFISREYLEIIHRELGPPQINSGFRTPALNAVIPGSSDSSDHSKALAVDFEIKGYNSERLKDAIVKLVKDGKLPTPDQIIVYPGKNYVHIGVRMSDPRGQVLKKTGPDKYKEIGTVKGKKKANTNNIEKGVGHFYIPANQPNFRKPVTIDDMRTQAGDNTTTTQVQWTSEASTANNYDLCNADINQGLSGKRDVPADPNIHLPACFTGADQPAPATPEPTTEQKRIASQEIARNIANSSTVSTTESVLRDIQAPTTTIFQRTYTPQEFIQAMYIPHPSYKKDGNGNYITNSSGDKIVIPEGKQTVNHSISTIAKSFYTVPSTSASQALKQGINPAMVRIPTQSNAEKALLQYGHYIWNHAQNNMQDWSMTPTQARLAQQWGIDSISRSVYKEKEGLDLPRNYLKKSFKGWRLSGQTKQILLAQLRREFVGQTSGRGYNEELELYVWGRVSQLAKKKLATTSGNKKQQLLSLIEELQHKNFKQIQGNSTLEELKTEARQEFKQVLHGKSYELVHSSYRPLELGELFLQAKEQELQQAFFADLLVELNRQLKRDPGASDKQLMTLAAKKFVGVDFNSVLKTQTSREVNFAVLKARQSLSLKTWWLNNHGSLAGADNDKVKALIENSYTATINDPTFIGDYAIGATILKHRQRAKR